MTIDQLSEKRKKLHQQLIENEAMDGFKELLTVLYSDKVHFIYELLQNAEDAGASEVKFVLDTDKLEFEHNGDQLFEIEDVESITNIGSSTKTDDATSIGKFGIGFKAVFAYTSTPEIESGPFHFRIRDMFVPDTDGLPTGGLGERRTRFIFPFDNPDKLPEEANKEIETKFRQLNETTLLFLSNIRKIEYRLPNLKTGYLERRKVANDDNRIEISVMHPENLVPDSTHYLRFTKEVDVQDEDGDFKHCQIAIAYGMDKPEGRDWKITPLNPGQVSIYFPAVKETSNLRFHLHAPFASTVARDSVRDYPANDTLRDHLAELIAESMHNMRDRGLLDVEFLATLPNNRDYLLPFYLPIQKRLIEEFNKEKLTPMKQRGRHAAASLCYRSRRTDLSNLLDDSDLATLLGKDCSQPLWIANPQRLDSSPEDNFLSMLSISQWDIEKLIVVLDNQSDTVAKWLREKPDDWHQDLYVLLGDFLSRSPSSPLYIARERKEKLSNLRIVRCTDDKYRTGNKCHFLDNKIGSEFQGEKAQEGEFHYVAKGVYSSGQNENQQEKSHGFLEKIGVCRVDEAEYVKMILRQRYEDPGTIIPSELHEEDMKRFISLVEKEPDKAILFRGYNIFNTSGGNCPTSLVFLDAPYLETGLAEYYEDDKCDIECLEKYDCVYFSLDYEQSNIDLKKLGKFAEALDAKTKLEVTKQTIQHDHPQFHYLRSAPGWRWTYTGIDEDYSIPEFPILLANPSIIKSRLVWEAMNSAPDNSLKSRFRWNQTYDSHYGNSTLVHNLKKAKWVPQKNGDTISFVRPCDALRDNLPGGFPYDTEQKWLEAIEFGKAAIQQRLENIHKEIEQKALDQKARDLDFNSADEAKKAAEFFKEQRKTPDELLKNLRTQKRRKELLIIELSNAEEKEYEKRAISIRPTRSTIDPRTALREQYTKTDEKRMFCQMCSKGMPFQTRRNSDEDYFEAVEALGKGYFFKEHEAQYLALCPECAAKYKEFVKRDKNARDALYDTLKNSDSRQILLESNGQTIRIWFEEKHWEDLKTVVYYYEKIYDRDESD